MKVLALPGNLRHVAIPGNRPPEDNKIRRPRFRLMGQFRYMGLYIGEAGGIVKVRVIRESGKAEAAGAVI